MDLEKLAQLEDTIKATDHYDFTDIYNFINNLYQNCRTVDDDVIKKLMQFEDNTKNNFLMWCCKRPHLQPFILWLIDNYGCHCKIDLINHSGNTVLLIACSTKMSDVVVKLIDKYGVGCKIDHNNADGVTALMWACKHKLHVAVKLIDEYSAYCNIGHVNKCGETALIVACAYYWPEIALKMIDKFGNQCDFDQVSGYGYSAASYAKQNEMSDVWWRLTTA